MKNLIRTNLGILFALLAALCNSTIGIFTNIGIGEDFDPDAIAFYKCLVAFFITSIFLLIEKKSTRSRGNNEDFLFSSRHIFQVSICSFFGIFGLYFFETLSYKYSPITDVTFLLMATSICITFILAKFFLYENLNLIKLLSLLVVLIGMCLLIMNNFFKNNIGNFFAILAGISYSLFLLLTKKFGFKSSLQNLWLFFGIGSLYLAVPFFTFSREFINFTALPIIFLLGVVPTLGGFYFTTKALQYIEASKTQLFELTEPVFASLLALIILSQTISLKQALGGALILIGIFISEKKKISKSI